MSTCNDDQTPLQQKLAEIGPERVESDGLVVKERSADDIRKLLILDSSFGKRRGFRAVAKTQFLKPGAWDRG